MLGRRSDLGDRLRKLAMRPRSGIMCNWIGGLLVLWIASAATAGEPIAHPKVLDDGYQLELLAAEPDIVTPVGLDFDKKGRLLVIESHTHFPPKDYPGPKTDRIRVLEETDRKGKAR